MIPSVVATQVRNCVSDYLHTTFRPTTPGFAGLIDRFLAAPDHVCRGHYVSIGLPFRPGAGSTPFREIPLNFTPHLHQERAFGRLSPPYCISTASLSQKRFGYSCPTKTFGRIRGYIPLSLRCNLA